jgi:hypothetical protein
MYWVLIEILHQQEQGEISEEELKEYINFYCHFNNQGEHLLNKIEQMLIESKLLTKFNGKISSNRVLKNKQHRDEISTKRSLAGKKSAESRLKPTIVEQSLAIVNNIKERKGKEIKEKKIISDLDFIESLKTNPAYKHVDFEVELGKVDAWLLNHPNRKKTRSFVLRWLNKVEKPMGVVEPKTKPVDPNCPLCKGVGFVYVESLSANKMCDCRRKI